MIRKLILKIIAKYLNDIALEECCKNTLCNTCPFGTEECECEINQVIKVIEKAGGRQ